MNIKNKSLYSKLFILSASLGSLKVLMLVRPLADFFALNIPHAMLSAFGGVGLNYPKATFQLLLVILESYMVLELLGGGLIDDILKNGCYIFTRLENRMVFMKRKTVELFAQISFFYLVQVFTVGMWIVCIYKYKNISQLALDAAVIGLFYILQLFFITLSLFVLSLYYKLNLSRLVIITIQVLMLLVASSIIDLFSELEYVIKFLPMVQGIYIYHDSAFFQGELWKMVAHPLRGFGDLYAMVYLIIGNVILYYVGAKRLKKMDIIGR